MRYRHEALKKRFKYLYLKYVFDFYEMNKETKHQLKTQEHRLKCGAARVAYGNPTYLLDATNYIKEAWQSVSWSSIKNSFVKADLIKLEADK